MSKFKAALSARERVARALAEPPKKRGRGRPNGTQRIAYTDLCWIALIETQFIERFPERDPEDVFRQAVQSLEDHKWLPVQSRGAHFKRLRAHWRTIRRLKKEAREK